MSNATKTRQLERAYTDAETRDMMQLIALGKATEIKRALDRENRIARIDAALRDATETAILRK